MKNFIKNKITIIHGNDGSDVRVGKMCRSLSRLGFDVCFIGWDRRPNLREKSIDLGGADFRLFKHETRNGRCSLLGQIKFTYFAIRELRKQKAYTLCVVNEDLALMFLPFRRMLFSKIVCDIFDPFNDRHSGKGWFFSTFAKFVSFVSRTFCDHLIVTDENRKNRLGEYSSKSSVIENFPEDPGPELCQSLPEGGLRIYVSGTLNEGRGLRQILKVVEASVDVEIVAAGWIYDDYTSEYFVNHPKVDYRGVVTLATSLVLASQCDAVLSFYAPSSDNNINASPNKIYDALAVGRPSIVNSEVLVSEWVIERGYGFCCAYDDVDALKDLINRLRSHRLDLSIRSLKWYSEFQDDYCWSRMEESLEEMYRNI
ncbi:hypothetical protein N9H09_00215 [bacterium]|nr:hypothetical protein [bacterium]